MTSGAIWPPHNCRIRKKNLKRTFKKSQKLKPKETNQTKRGIADGGTCHHRSDFAGEGCQPLWTVDPCRQVELDIDGVELEQHRWACADLVQVADWRMRWKFAKDWKGSFFRNVGNPESMEFGTFIRCSLKSQGQTWLRCRTWQTWSTNRVQLQRPASSLEPKMICEILVS